MAYYVFEVICPEGALFVKGYEVDVSHDSHHRN